MTILRRHAVGKDLFRAFGQLEFVGGGEPTASTFAGSSGVFLRVAGLLSFFLGPHREGLSDPGGAGAARFLFEFFAALQLAGEQDVLHGLFTDVQARLVARAYAARPQELIGAVLGLERDYLIYSLFGLVYELHAVLSKMVGRSSPDQEVTVPTSTEEGLTLAGALAQGLEPVRKHLDKVCYYLPSVLVEWDAAICQPGASPLPGWLKMHERNYRMVLTAVAPVAAEVRMLRELLLRIHGVEARLKRGADYSGLTASLVLGAALNPFFLISAAQQGIAISKQAEKQKVEQSDLAGQVVERVLRQWNYLVLEFLPSLWHHLLDGLFPMRVELYERLRKQLTEASAADKDALTARLARRFAALTVFLKYPENTTSEHPRGAVVAVMRRLQERLSYAGFQTI